MRNRNNINHQNRPKFHNPIPRTQILIEENFESRTLLLKNLIVRRRPPNPFRHSRQSSSVRPTSGRYLRCSLFLVLRPTARLSSSKPRSSSSSAAPSSSARLRDHAQARCFSLSLPPSFWFSGIPFPSLRFFSLSLFFFAFSLFGFLVKRDG